MDYECQVVPCDKTIVDGEGIKEPLCNDCLAPDCTNPIRDKTMYIMGIPKRMRLWETNNIVRQVVMCKGYVSKNNVVVRTNKANGDRSQGGDPSPDATDPTGD